MVDEVKRPRRWLRVVLVLSLALNLMVLGVVAGGAVKGYGKQGHHARMEQMGGPMSRALSKDDRREIGREMRRMSRAQGSGRGQYFEVIGAMAADLRAERFDRAAVEARMAAQRSVVSERMALGHGLLLDRLEQMSPQERAAFADRLEEGMQRKRP